MNKIRKSILLVGVLLSATMVISQTDSTAASAATDNTVKLTEEISAFEFIMKGGVFLIPIVILLMYTIFFAVEKYRYITRMSKFNNAVLSDIKSNLQAGNLAPVLETVSRDTTAYGSVLKESIYVFYS